MRGADLAKANEDGLSKLSQLLDEHELEHIKTHPEQMEVDKHFAVEIKELKLKHVSVPLRSYAKQCRKLLDKH